MNEHTSCHATVVPRFPSQASPFISSRQEMQNVNFCTGRIKGIVVISEHTTWCYALRRAADSNGATALAH